jgi:hypothetical protein
MSLADVPLEYFTQRILRDFVRNSWNAVASTFNVCLGTPRVPAVMATAMAANPQTIAGAQRATNELAITQAEQPRSCQSRGRREVCAPRNGWTAVGGRTDVYIDKWKGQWPSGQAGQGTSFLTEWPRSQGTPGISGRMEECGDASLTCTG